ncbi:hypothetical protein M3Y94_00578600 [Aphelenchoides besseyi]|nr:hypothetical protein M3Y94_00578600 [Aphelenchoides besseyi]KAI6222004.1 hypothetical protein M3Y95_00938700 [Aphelenchoides besseyi]
MRAVSILLISVFVIPLVASRFYDPQNGEWCTMCTKFFEFLKVEIPQIAHLSEDVLVEQINNTCKKYDIPAQMCDMAINEVKSLYDIIIAQDKINPKVLCQSLRLC